MTPEFWAIIGVGAVLALVNYVAADENEKRLTRIIGLLIDLRKQGEPHDDYFD